MPQSPNKSQQTSPAPLISCRGLHITYPNGLHALHDINLDLFSHKIYGLVGPNGAGKSTLFKSLMGFITPNQGAITIQNKAVQSMLKRNMVSYVPQSENIDWDFPILVRDVVMMGRYGHMNFMRLPRKIDRLIMAEALDRVGLTGYETRQIGELSGGQRKRVFLARALAQHAPIMLLDEPFTGVDAKTEAAIIDILTALKADGMLVLISTHNLDTIPKFCDEVIFIDRQLIAKGAASDVLKGYAPLSPNKAASS